jgi:DNA primase catalytic subunit
MAIRLTPSGIFFSPVEWLDPIHLRLTRATVRDMLLTSPLYFDIDVRKGERIQVAKAAAAELIETIRRLSNRDPDLLVFSGRNGFHIYYWNWDEIPAQFPNPKDRINEFVKSRRQMLHYLDSKGVRIDNTVTVDPWRILRLPGSVHWSTGLTACLVRDLTQFLPNRDAALFPPKTYRDVFGINLDSL